VQRGFPRQDSASPHAPFEASLAWPTAWKRTLSLDPGTSLKFS